MKRTICILVLGLLPGCNSKRAEGQNCNTNEDCAANLVCVADQCADSVRVARSRAKRIVELVQRFQSDNKGECPKGIDDLRDDTARVDPWGNKFSVQCPGTRGPVDVVSAGPDGEHGNADDIANYEAKAE